MEKYFYTGLLNGNYFACFKFCDVPYDLERIKYVRATSKSKAIKARRAYDEFHAMLADPQTPRSNVALIISRITALKLRHDIHG